MGVSLDYIIYRLYIRLCLYIIIVPTVPMYYSTYSTYIEGGQKSVPIRWVLYLRHVLYLRVVALQIFILIDCN